MQEFELHISISVREGVSPLIEMGRGHGIATKETFFRPPAAQTLLT